MGFWGKIFGWLPFVSKESDITRPEPSHVETGQKNKAGRNPFLRTPRLEDRPIHLDTSFSSQYSTGLHRLSNDYVDVSPSNSAMPSTLVPSEPEVGEAAQTSSALPVIKAFSPLSQPSPVSTVWMASERKRKDALMQASFVQRVNESTALLGSGRFDEALSIAQALANETQGNPKYAAMYSQATSLISRIEEAREQKRREEEERARRAREEQERRRLEKERKDRKQALLEAVERMLALAEGADWDNALELRNSLIGEVSGFGDQELSDKLKGALARYEDIKNAYRRRQEQIRREQEARREQARREAQARREQEQVVAVRGWIADFRRASQEARWSDCTLLKGRIERVIGSISDPSVREEYQGAVEYYNTCQDAQRTRQRQEAEQRERQERERQALARQEAERQVREAEQARRREVRNRYIVESLSGGGECFCLHYYYKTSHGAVSDGDQRTRNLVFAFKDKFHNKSIFEINRARSVFSDEVSTLLKKLYGDSIGDVWFCTAQASTPESADRRFKAFCEKVSAACGVNNGYELIEVTGTKLSASTEGGVRGDISNLSISSAVMGKKIVLFDDIITSGKSMSNLKSALLAKGAASVDCVAFGRTV